MERRRGREPSARVVLMLAALLLARPVCSDMLTLSALPDSPADDVSADILTEAYAHLGVRLHIVHAPAEPALVRASEGKNDGVVQRMDGIDQYYPNLIPVPVRINHEEAVVFTRGKVFPVDGWQSLRPWRLGIRRGIKFIEQGTERMNVHDATSNEQLFQMLVLDRVDAVVLPRSLGLAALQRLGIRDVRMLEPAVASVDLYHFLHERHRDRLPAITAVLRDMAQSGRLDQIRQHHMTPIIAP